MTTVEVLMDVKGQARPVGQAYFTRTRGQISTTFLYNPTWLAGEGMSIAPALPLVSGAQHQAGLVSAFGDSAPDRWGRNLIERAERTRAREAGTAPRQVDDVDFLLGVSDDARQGALRFRLPGQQEFVGKPSTVPKLVSLPELLRASDELGANDNPSWAVKRLLDTGTTGLGGARPKASVRLDDGSLGIAKFPHAADQWDVMAWEATALDLLEAAGIRTPSRTLTRVAGRSVLILRRFDRTAPGHRIGYISAMTATGSADGDHRDYADVAYAMRDLSRSAKADHHQWFDRAVASVALGNTDDHLRNHGFLAVHGSWTLSPVFDVNPNPDLWQTRATSIMGADSVGDEVDGLLALAEHCSLNAGQARERMRRVVMALSGWKEQARKNRVAPSEITMMANSIEPRLKAVSTAATAP